MTSISDAVLDYWKRYLDTLPAGHAHRFARPVAFAFGDTPELAGELAALVRAGRKRATASLQVEFTAVGDDLPVAGDVCIVTLADGAPVAIIELVEVRHVPFNLVDEAFAAAEGEGDGSLESWRAAHREYFGRVGASLGGGFNEATPVICQRFRLLWDGNQCTMKIRVDDLSGPEIAQLLRDHLLDLARHSPAESMHALDLAALRKPGITFWSAWQGADLLGCGALKELDPRHGEIKSMRTVAAHLRKGVAAAILRHILEEAGRRSYRRLSLETGSGEAFSRAQSLYARFGFQPCGPFADYVLDPYSVFMTLEL